MPFQYKRVLVIGATSGIGQALAERFITEGAFVIVTGRRKERLDEFVQKHGAEKSASMTFDVSKLATIPGFVQEVTGKYPDIDLFFLNAGMQRGSFFNDPSSIKLESIEEEMTVNYTAQLALTKEILSWALSKPEVPRTLLYTTSNLAVVPLVRCPNYSASKAALHAVILCLRAQLQGTNVRVHELLPPAVQTELHDEKFQPDIKNGRSFGMPLKEFTDQAYEAIAAGKETIFIGTQMFGDVVGVEEKRAGMFWDFVERVKANAGK